MKALGISCEQCLWAIGLLPTRWKLRSAIRIVNETLNLLKVEKHPEKTFIGKVERGFGFLGYFLKPGVLRVSRGTFERFTERISRLYEQGADYVRIGEYVRHWLKWVGSGIGGLAHMKAKEWIKKRLHPSLDEECRRRYNESNLVNNYLAFINGFLFPSTSCFCTCKSN